MTNQEITDFEEILKRIPILQSVPAHYSIEEVGNYLKENIDKIVQSIKEDKKT